MAVKQVLQVKRRSSSQFPEKSFGVQLLAEEVEFASVGKIFHLTMVLAKQERARSGSPGVLEGGDDVCECDTGLKRV